MPSFSRPTPSFFFSIPALKAGSKSFARVTLDPGVTRNGLMKRAIRLVMSSAMSLFPSSFAGRAEPTWARTARVAIRDEPRANPRRVWRRGALRDVALPAAELAQPVERLPFELPASLLAHTEARADLGVRLHVAGDAEATHQH